MREKFLDILIPTFNRAKDLRRNLEILAKQIFDDQLDQQVAIYVSDNCSEDETNAIVNQFIKQHATLDLKYSRNNSNIGLEPNVLQLLKEAQAPFLLWLGDDDYLAEGYLYYVCNQIVNSKVGVIIPGLGALKENGDILIQRDQSSPIIESTAGFDSMLTYSHLAHQMSGLVVKRSGLYEKYVSQEEWRNPYLFIFMTAYCLLHYNGLYVPKYVTRVSDFNSKDWGYNQVGLLDQVFKSYYPFLTELKEEKVRQLLLRFSTIHSYRYNISKWYPFRLIKQYRILIKAVPPIRKFKRSLAIQLLKDYLLTWKR